jgi:hypothetical protein
MEQKKILRRQKEKIQTAANNLERLRELEDCIYEQFLFTAVKYYLDRALVTLEEMKSKVNENKDA